MWFNSLLFYNTGKGKTWIALLHSNFSLSEAEMCCTQQALNMCAALAFFQMLQIFDYIKLM